MFLIYTGLLHQLEGIFAEATVPQNVHGDCLKEQNCANCQCIFFTFFKIHKSMLMFLVAYTSLPDTQP